MDAFPILFEVGDADQFCLSFLLAFLSYLGLCLVYSLFIVLVFLVLLSLLLLFVLRIWHSSETCFA